MSKQKAEKSLAWLNDVLADRQYIAGERYTVADIVAQCAVDFGRVVKITIQPDQKTWLAGTQPYPPDRAPRRNLQKIPSSEGWP